MTDFILKECLKYLTMIVMSDKFVRTFTESERTAFYRVQDAIESALHFPEKK